MQPGFNFARLFERAPYSKRKRVLYPNMKAHLDGMRSGKKAGLSLFGFPVSYMTERGPDYLELLKLAFERELVVVLHNNSIKNVPLERQCPNVFVARPEELWRLPAWIALWDTAMFGGTWTDGAEAQASLLLGYTRSERAAWIERMRELRAAYTGLTTYALLSPEQTRRVRSLGQRCFGDADDLSAITLRFKRNDYGLRPNAYRLIPRDLTLARVALVGATFRKLFGDYKTWKRREVIDARVPERLAAEFNRALTSRVHLLTPKGWR